MVPIDLSRGTGSALGGDQGGYLMPWFRCCRTIDPPERGSATIATGLLVLPGTLLPFSALPRCTVGVTAAGKAQREPAWTPNPPTSQPAPFPRERSICFPCRPDLWATLFFICLHKLSRVTCFFPPRGWDAVSTSGSQVSRPV